MQVQKALQYKNVLTKANNVMVYSVKVVIMDHERKRR